MNIRRNSFGNLGIPVRRRELGDTWAVTAGSRRGIQVRDRDGEIMPVQVRKRWSPDRGQRRTTFYKVAAKAIGALGIGIGAIDLGALGAGVQMLKFYGESSGWVYSVNRGTTPATIVIVAKPGVGKVSVPVDPSSGAYKAIAKALPTMRQLSMEAFEAQLKTHSAYKKTTTPRPSTPASQAASQVAADTVTPVKFDIQGALQKYGPWVAGAVGLLAVAGGIYLAMSPPKRTTIAVVGP